MSDYSVFSYKAGNSFLHTMPSWIKILLVPVFNIAVFSLDWKVSLVSIFLFVVIFFILKFSIAEQLNDLKPVFYYAQFIYVLNIGTQAYLNWNTGTLPDVLLLSVKRGICDMDTAFFMLRFFACVQSCSLMFKTSTSIEIRTGIETLELAVRKFLPVKKEASFAFAVSMMVNFIPAVFKLWHQLKRAWFARGGKNSIRMVTVLLPQLFSVGLRFAYSTTKALIVRGQK